VLYLVVGKKFGEENKMKKLIIITTFLFWTSVLANPIDDNCSEFVVNGAPQIKVEGNNQYICHKAYAINYNYKTKVAHFVVEHIKASDLTKAAKRKDDFRMDPLVSDDKEATLEDYANSGYDRGHIAPAADFSADAEEMSESFYLTNIMPQVPNNNRGIWKKTETMAREFAEKYGEVYVISGTIYDGDYLTIGNGVGVPTHIYKIIIDPKKNRAMSFLFENTKLKVATLPEHIVTIKEIENRAQVNFNPMLKDDSMEKQKADIGDW
jgi:endonuclease G